MKQNFIRRVSRLFAVTLLSSCCFFISQSTFATTYYIDGAELTCPDGYRLVLLPAMLDCNSNFMSSRYMCIPPTHYKYKKYCGCYYDSCAVRSYK